MKICKNSKFGRTKLSLEMVIRRFASDWDLMQDEVVEMLLDILNEWEEDLQEENECPCDLSREMLDKFEKIVKDCCKQEC